MLKNLRLMIALLLFLLSHVTLAQSQPPKKFIAIADIHFNPFIGCDISPQPCPLLSELRSAAPQSWDTVFQKYRDKIKTDYHQDTDYLLLISAFNEVEKQVQEQKPAFMLILGDFLAHRFPEQYQKYAEEPSTANYQAFVKKTFQYLAYKLNQAAPVTDIYPILGNNDSYGADYEVDPQGQFLKDVANIFSPLIHTQKNQKAFQDGFPNAGYYAATLNQKNQRLLVLDSVLFSAAHLPTSAMEKAAEEELTWLQAELDKAKKQKQNVLIALHIPPGIDTYLGLKTWTFAVQPLTHSLFWQEDYNKRFLSLMNDYANQIVGILPAHIHQDAFQLISSKDTRHIIPVSFTPSITPINGNNPGFKVFSYNAQTFQLINFNAYYDPINKDESEAWEQEYDFNAVYQPGCTECSLVTGMQRLKKNNALSDFYKKYYGVGTATQPIITQQAWLPYYWCSIYHLDWESYQACLLL